MTRLGNATPKCPDSKVARERSEPVGTRGNQRKREESRAAEGRWIEDKRRSREEEDTRDREGRYWPMCGGVMVAIGGSVPFVSPRAPIHHRASNYHSAVYLYTPVPYIYGARGAGRVYGPTDGYSARAHPPPLARRGTLRETNTRATTR